MTSFKFSVLAAALLLWGVQPCFAILPPRAKLLDNQVSSPCVKARPSWMTTGDKGPSVSLINKCKTGFAVNAVTKHDLDKPDKKADDIGLVLATRVDGYVQYIELRLKDGGKDCFTDAPAAKADGLVCKSVFVRPDDTLIIPVAWGTHYSIGGSVADGGAAQDFSASGWMLNPADPSQALDIIKHEALKTAPPQ